MGSSGTFSKPLLSESGKRCIGVECVDGTKWYADRVVLAAGAWTPTLVDLEGQCVSKVCDETLPSAPQFQEV